MNEVQKTLIQLMRAQINPELRLDIEIQCDWAELDDLIMNQGLGGALYPLICKLFQEGKVDAQIFISWRDMAIQAGLSQINRNVQIERALMVFQTENIPVIVLKGPAIAKLYEYPELRSMGDLDLLVQQTNVLKARHILESKGYTLVADNDKHPLQFPYIKSGEIDIDLHYALIRQDILGSEFTIPWYEHIWGNCVISSINNTQMVIMAAEDELINQIIHFARHLIGQGARLIHFFDIAMLIKKNGADWDWDYIKGRVDTFELGAFAAVIFGICTKFLDIYVPEQLLANRAMDPADLIELFRNDYMLDGFQVGSRLKEGKYKLLFERTYALPLAYIFEFCGQYILRRNNFTQSIDLARQNVNQYRKKMRLLRQLQLKGWVRSTTPMNDR